MTLETKEITFAKMRYTPQELNTDFKYCYLNGFLSGWRVFAINPDGNEVMVRGKTDRLYNFALFKKFIKYSESEKEEKELPWECENLSWYEHFNGLRSSYHNDLDYRSAIKPVTYEARLTRLGKKLFGKPITLTRQYPESPFYYFRYNIKDDIR